MLISDELPVSYPMREPCRGCGGLEGIIVQKGGQDGVRCVACNRYCYNAPRVETGRAVRSVTTVHNGVRARVRHTVLERARGRCELCGSSRDLVVAHLLSVVDGLADGFTEILLNSADNLAAFCAECNLGEGARSAHPVLYLAIVHRWLRSSERGPSG